MTIDLTVPAATFAIATDARGADDHGDHGGYGIVGLDLHEDEILGLWKCSHNPGFSVARLDGSLAHKLGTDKNLAPTVPHTKLPTAIFKREWPVLASGVWRYTDHITCGEARAHFKALQAMASNIRLHRRRYIFLEDNFPVAAAYSKGRATSHALNFYCRRRSASSLASQIFSALPWVQTSLMPADDASRLGTVKDGAAADFSGSSADDHWTAGSRPAHQKPNHSSFIGTIPEVPEVVPVVHH